MSAIQHVTPAARRYARALFEVALEKGVLAEVERDVEIIRHATSHPEVESWLADPRVEAARKQSLLDREFGSRVHPVTQGLLRTIGRRGRHAILPQLPAAFGELSDEHAGRLRGLAECALPLTDDDRRGLEQALSARTGKQVSLVSKVDPRLLGGLRVTLGGTRYDGSARSMLEQIRRSMENADLSSA